MSQITPIAHIRSSFADKFAIPRQSNVVDGLLATIVFEPEYRYPEALRGIEGFEFLWLIWQFSLNNPSQWSPTVRPPRLGGNQRIGVFATRSPFRPNQLGLSSVRLVKVDNTTPEGPILVVDGADLADGTPIFDIKPYIPYTDSHPMARSGFAQSKPENRLTVRCDDNCIEKIPSQLRNPLIETLSLDPRPAYHTDPTRIYAFNFSGFEISFKVQQDNVLHVIGIK